MSARTFECRAKASGRYLTLTDIRAQIFDILASSR